MFFLCLLTFALQKYAEKALTTQCIGTMRWQAPETFQSPPVWLLAADIFSLGMVFYEIMTGKIPYEGTKYYYCVIMLMTIKVKPIEYQRKSETESGRCFQRRAIK